MNPTEARVQHDILLAWGCHPMLRIARINVGAAKIRGTFVRFGVPGTADIVGLMLPHGRMLQIECKTATGKQRKAQEVMQRVITRWGGLYIVARSVQDVDQALAAIGITR